MADALKLKFKTLAFGTQVIECHLDGSFFDTQGTIEVRSADVDATVAVTRKSDNTYRLEIECAGTLTTSCDRCLDDLTMPVDAAYDLNVEQMGTALDDSNDELLIVPSDWQELDVAPIVRDTVLLSMPMTHCHDDESQCNAGVLAALDNHRAEAVPDGDDIDNESTGSVDPRWAALNKLKEQ